MNLKKLIPAFLFSLVLLAGALPLQAGPEGKNTADPTYDDGGNDVRYRAVPANTAIPVLLSSAAYNYSAPGVPTFEVWRFREIVNCSNGQLMITRNRDSFQTFSSTAGHIILSSDTTGGNAGDVYAVPHQGEVWGIWSPGTTTGGACVEQTFWNPSKRR